MTSATSKSRRRTDPVQRVVERLADRRSRRVVFVSHCLLNENTRYLGGAFQPGVAVDLIEELIEQRVGIVQMPCPEQHAWGGVDKRLMLRGYGTRNSVLYHLRRLLLAMFVWRTHRVYRHLARQVATQIADYQRAGYTIAGIIGVAASPSCGVCTRLNITRAFDAMADLPVHSLTPERVNHDVVLACREPGEGLFINGLRRELDQRHLSVPFYEYDLVLEMRRKPQHVLRQPHVP